MLTVGSTAPDFTLRDQNRQPVTLSDYRVGEGARNVLLVFFPLAFTGICQGELGQLRDHLPDFENDDSVVLAISVGPPPTHKVWAAENGFLFPVLSDFWPHGAVAKAYGVFDENMGIATRGTFIIDKNGVVRWKVVNPVPQARDIAEYQKALAELD